MLFKSENYVTIFQTDGVVGKRIFSDGNQEIVFFKLNKNAIIDTHSLDIDVKFFILKGRGKVLLGDKAIIAEKNDLIGVEPGIKRKWINMGDTDLEVLVIKQLT